MSEIRLPGTVGRTLYARSTVGKVTLRAHSDGTTCYDVALKRDEILALRDFLDAALQTKAYRVSAIYADQIGYERKIDAYDESEIPEAYRPFTGGAKPLAYRVIDTDGNAKVVPA